MRTHYQIKPASRSRTDCFSDEIAIDFPSVSRVLARLRTNFFAAEPAVPPVTAQIDLTPREASSGLTVPFDVPVRHMCSTCGGRGEIWLERCQPCSGTGDSILPHQVSLVVPAGVRDGDRFRFSVMPPTAAATLVEVRINVS